MLTIMSTVIAFPGTLNRFSFPSRLTVIPSREMPKSARPPSAVAVFMVMMKLCDQADDEEVRDSLVEPRILSIAARVVVARDELRAGTADEARSGA